MAIIRDHNVPLFLACATHGHDWSNGCMTCRLVIRPAINKALSNTPCDCGKDSLYFWQTPGKLREYNATCEAHTPEHLIATAQ